MADVADTRSFFQKAGDKLGSIATNIGASLKDRVEKLWKKTPFYKKSENEVETERLQEQFELYNEGLYGASGFNEGSPNCDKYITEVLRTGNSLPEGWPDPSGYKVAKTSADEKNTYLDYLSESLLREPAPGMNVMLMTGGSHPEYPHMALVFVKENGKVDFTHYTDNTILDREDWKSIGKVENNFAYDNFYYYPIISSIEY